MPRKKSKAKRFRKAFVFKSLKKIRRLSFRDIAFLIVVSLYIAGAVFRLSDPVLWGKRIDESHAVIVPQTKLPPTQIKIPKFNLDLLISAGLVDGNTWDLYDDKIAWLATSAVPGEGNVILYGHDRRGLFGDLYKLKVGDLIEVK